MSVGTTKLDNNKIAIIYRIDNKNFGNSMPLVDDKGKRIPDNIIIDGMETILKFAGLLTSNVPPEETSSVISTSVNPLLVSITGKFAKGVL